jgi:glycine/D-amino acid oxidase-like deaminating enzyme
MPMLSYWEKNSFTDYDFIIVGGGITGLSTAACILEKKPWARVLILERGVFPAGASTKNAGFACFGSATELLSDIKLMGETRTLELVELRYKGLEMLKKRLGKDAMDYQMNGGYELIGESELHFLDQLDYLNNLLRPIFKQDLFILVNNKIDVFGFSREYVKQLIFNPLEGQIDTGKMMQALIKHVTRLGAFIINGYEVTDFDEQPGKVFISGRHALSDTEIKFSCNKAAFCTNAFTRRFFPELDIQPGRGQVLVTRPIEKLNFEGVFHFDEGYYYFRNHGKRVIFGGGRNLDFEGEATDAIEVNNFILSHLKQKLKNIILPNYDFEIEHNWAGIMAFGQDKMPIVKHASENITVAARLSGMGIALGSHIGKTVSQMMMEEKDIKISL